METVEQYNKRLSQCPDPDSDKFIDYLRDNNEVVDENHSWLLIKNCKYHREGISAYYTAFFKPTTHYKRITVNLLFPSEWSSLFRLYQKHCDGWEVCIKADKDKSVSRFHVHFVEYGQEVVRKHRLGVNDKHNSTRTDTIEEEQ